MTTSSVTSAENRDLSQHLSIPVFECLQCTCFHISFDFLKGDNLKKGTDKR